MHMPLSFHASQTLLPFVEPSIELPPCYLIPHTSQPLKDEFKEQKIRKSSAGYKFIWSIKKYSKNYVSKIIIPKFKKGM